MPTYQYTCTACGHDLEAVQSFSDDPLTVCPECAGRLRKVFSAVGVVFKGSGFYRNDSRAGNGGADGSEGSDAKSGSGKEKVGAASNPGGAESGGSGSGGSGSGGSGSGSSGGSASANGSSGAGSGGSGGSAKSAPAAAR